MLRPTSSTLVAPPAPMTPAAPSALHPMFAAILSAHFAAPSAPRVQVEGQPCIHCGNPEPQTLLDPCDGCVGLNAWLDACAAQRDAEREGN